MPTSTRRSGSTPHQTSNLVVDPLKAQGERPKVVQAQSMQGSQTHGSKDVGGVTRKILVLEVGFSFPVELYRLPVVGGF